jgi:predicted RNA-binding protein with TRAM domain
MQVNNIETLIYISDGDTIVPGMEFVLSNGIGTTQYYNPNTGKVSPDYTSKDVSVVLWPKCYSSSLGQFIVPEKDANGVGTWQWYLNSPESEANALLASAGGKSKNALFEATTVTMSGKTYPALKVVGNLASADSPNDVTIYCKFTYNGLTVTCHATIGVKVTTGEAYEVLISCEGDDGSGDSVIDDETEKLVLTAALQKNGESVTDALSWEWYRQTTTGLKKVEVDDGDSNVWAIGGTNGNQLTLMEAAVDGMEEYFAQTTYNGSTYRKGIQVTDVQDVYYIDMGRSGSTILSVGDTTSYTPKVLSRKDKTVQSGWTFAFTLTDNEGNVVDGGTITSNNGSTTLSVDYALVKKYDGLNVRVTATKA